MTLDDRVTRLETIMEEILRRLDRFETRLDRLESKMDTQFRWLVGIQISILVVQITTMAAILFVFAK